MGQMQGSSSAVTSMFGLNGDITDKEVTEQLSDLDAVETSYHNLLFPDKAGSLIAGALYIF